MGEDYNKITLIKKYLGKFFIKKMFSSLNKLMQTNGLIQQLIKRELRAFTTRWSTIGF
jgi:hypothetical protein